jgi:hypothetical protein
MSSKRKIMFEVFDSASTLPFRRRRIRRLYRSAGISSGVTIQGPMGPYVSMDLPQGWNSRLFASSARPVMSLKIV